jgi:FlaG/FlaF family flagellin (archaellin)
MSIRKVQMLPEAVYGTAAVGTYVALPGTKFSDKHKQNRAKPKIITGSRWDFNETRLTNAEAPCTLEMPLYYAMTCYAMALHCGPPVTAAVGGATGAFTNTFTPGLSTILSGTFQYKKVSSQNAGEWYQQTGVAFDKCTVAQNNKGIPTCTFEGYGMTPTNIAAPSESALAIEAYVHPNIAQYSVTKGGSAWKKATKLDIMTQQGYQPDWTLGSGVSPSRMKLGGASGTFKGQAFQDDYTGSIMETGDGSGLLGQYIITYQGTDAIGTGTPTTPRVQVTVPSPYVDTVTAVDTDSDDEESFDVSFGFNAALNSGMKYEFRNTLAASVFVGS